MLHQSVKKIGYDKEEEFFHLMNKALIENLREQMGLGNSEHADPPQNPQDICTAADNYLERVKNR